MNHTQGKLELLTIHTIIKVFSYEQDFRLTAMPRYMWTHN